MLTARWCLFSVCLSLVTGLHSVGNVVGLSPLLDSALLPLGSNAGSGVGHAQKGLCREGLWRLDSYHMVTRLRGGWKQGEGGGGGGKGYSVPAPKVWYKGMGEGGRGGSTPKGTPKGMSKVLRDPSAESTGKHPHTSTPPPRGVPSKATTPKKTGTPTPNKRMTATSPTATPNKMESPISERKSPKATDGSGPTASPVTPTQGIVGARSRLEVLKARAAESSNSTPKGKEDGGGNPRAKDSRTDIRIRNRRTVRRFRGRKTSILQAGIVDQGTLDPGAHVDSMDDLANKFSHMRLRTERTRGKSRDDGDDDDSDDEEDDGDDDDEKSDDEDEDESSWDEEGTDDDYDGEGEEGEGEEETQTDAGEEKKKKKRGNFLWSFVRMMSGESMHDAFDKDQSDSDDGGGGDGVHRGRSANKTMKIVMPKKFMEVSTSKRIAKMQARMDSFEQGLAGKYGRASWADHFVDECIDWYWCMPRFVRRRIDVFSDRTTETRAAVFLVLKHIWAVTVWHLDPLMPLFRWAYRTFDRFWVHICTVGMNKYHFTAAWLLYLASQNLLYWYMVGTEGFNEGHPLFNRVNEQHEFYSYFKAVFMPQMPEWILDYAAEEKKHVLLAASKVTSEVFANGGGIIEAAIAASRAALNMTYRFDKGDDLPFEDEEEMEEDCMKEMPTFEWLHDWWHDIPEAGGETAEEHLSGNDALISPFDPSLPVLSVKSVQSLLSGKHKQGFHDSVRGEAGQEEEV